MVTDAAWGHAAYNNGRNRRHVRPRFVVTQRNRGL